MPLDENIKLTKQVVKVAHAKHVWVQGEVGSIVGSHGDIKSKLKDIPLAKLDEVIEFVKMTKVDTIAAAVGTAHGIHANEDIVFSLLKAIKNKVKIPFILHGGSGVPDAKIKKAIKEGVNIINVGTDLKLAFCRALIEVCLKNKEETDPRNLLKPTIGAVEKVVILKMKLFGSAGRTAIGKIET